MRRSTRTPIATATALACALAASPASASGVSRSWVSPTGNDTNNGTCSIAAPCKTFQHAHDMTLAGGELSVLRAGSYGSLTIAKSISMTNDGAGEAEITGGIDGIDIQANAGDVIGLRGLTIDGSQFPGKGTGVTFGAGASAALHVQNCVIRNFARGIVMVAGASMRMLVSDTLIYNNGSVGAGSATSGGIFAAAIGLQGAGANAEVVLNRVRLENNQNGLIVVGNQPPVEGPQLHDGPSHVILRNSIVSGSAANGIWAVTAAGAAPVAIFVRNTAAVGNGAAGILADGPGATIAIGRVTVARNATGLTASNGGQIFSYSDNEIGNNIGADGAPTGFFTPR